MHTVSTFAELVEDRETLSLAHEALERLRPFLGEAWTDTTLERLTDAEDRVLAILKLQQ